MRDAGDTIAAIATPKGEGGIAIVRISGADAGTILRKMLPSKRKPFEHAKMTHGFCVNENGEPLDEVMAVLFRAPKSYTREDVAEIHCHGGTFIAGRVLETAVKLGARPAERGEFTYRAFLNGRIDASQAEAVMAVIGAGSENAARNALRQLRGGVSARIGACRNRLLECVELIDAAADFPEEIDEEVTGARVRSLCADVMNMLIRAADGHAARICAEGARVVIAGRPNVGKSSILNAILGSERAIVTDIPGTTRDAVSESVTIDGMKLTFTDTAGIRETGDTVEKIGVERAKEALSTADCAILVTDASAELTDEDRELLALRDGSWIWAANKADIAEHCGGADVFVSAKTGQGMRELLSRVVKMCAVGADDEKLMSLRHVACAERAIQALDGIVNGTEGAYLDLLREGATEALRALGEITGENVSETVIDGIFERFCVGK